MESIYIHGGIRLQGQVRVQGSKNAVLPILAACILMSGKSTIHNCPRLKDVFCMQSLLKSLGAKVTYRASDIRVDASKVSAGFMHKKLQGEAVCSMRSSVTLLGAMLGRFKEACMEYPGGCVIGERPIDIHRFALQKMGVEFAECKDGIQASVKELKGNDIILPIPSVGATENVILAAVCAEGTTRLFGAAKEPEIVSLCEFLRLAGADITGDGTDFIEITGKRPLYGAEYTVPGDRIVAGTYLCACMAGGGEVFLQDAPLSQMDAQIACAEEMGAMCQKTEEGLYVRMKCRPKAIPFIKTEPYPGFPTDMQSLFLAVLAVAEGESVLEETIFENRFLILPDLRCMGADVRQVGASAVKVKGVEHLTGYPVEAKELRGGAALIVAGIAAKDVTVVEGCRYIERGYENICKDLRELGVRIYGV